MPGSNSRLNVSEGYEVPLSYRGDRQWGTNKKNKTAKQKTEEKKEEKREENKERVEDRGESGAGRAMKVKLFCCQKEDKGQRKGTRPTPKPFQALYKYETAKLATGEIAEDIYRR